VRGPEAETGRRQVAGASSARKLLHVLLCFTPERPLWTVAELCAELELSQPTVYRFVALLRETGLLEASGDNHYRVGEQVVSLARAAERAGASLEEVAMPVMRRIRDRVDETVLVARRNRTYAYCVDRVESRKPVRLQFDKGQPMSLHRGSLARVLLAAMPADERRAYVDGLPADDARSALLSADSLDDVLAQGWTQSFEEVDDGIWGVAAGVVVNKQVVASLGVAAPLYRLDARQRGEIIDAVRDGATSISAALQSEDD
jgi:DNA-binding IclR family transcriptional regulator